MNPRRPARKRTRRRSASILRGAYYFFLALGTLALGYAGYVAADAQDYQTVEHRRFEHASRRAEPRSPMKGDVIGEIQALRLGLNAIVVQGDSPKILQRAVGHIPETALPGEMGNVVLAGHRDTFFRPLREVRPGDVITLKTPDGSFQYRVESTAVVPPSDVRVLQASSERTLTLITCFPFHYVGPAPNRYIVRAREVGTSPEQLTER
jgi:sortase A